MYKNIFKYDDMKRSEHMAVRKNVGWYFWTHQLIEITGPDVVAFLDHIYTGNIASLGVGRDRYTTMLNEQGEIIQDGEVVAKLKITDFADYNYLRHYGENYYVPVEGAQLQDATDCKVYQGYLETSNVNVVSEMVEMISVSRQYESNQKVIQTLDSSLQIAATQLGKV